MYDPHHPHPEDDAEAHRTIARIDALSSHHDALHAGCRVRWRRFGPPDAAARHPPLVLLHGGHGTWLHWLRNVEALSAERAVWVPDMPGFGESDVPPASIEPGRHPLAPLLDALIGTLDQLIGDTTSIDVCGFSFGAFVASRLVGRRALVRRLALVGSGGHGTVRRMQVEMINWRAAPDREAERVALVHNLGALMLHDRQSIDALAFAIHDVSCHGTRFRSKDVSLAGGLQDALDAFEGETCLLWGEHDVTADARPLVASLVAGRPKRKGRGRGWRRALGAIRKARSRRCRPAWVFKPETNRRLMHSAHCAPMCPLAPYVRSNCDCCGRNLLFDLIDIDSSGRVSLNSLVASDVDLMTSDSDAEFIKKFIKKSSTLISKDDLQAFQKDINFYQIKFSGNNLDTVLSLALLHWQAGEVKIAREELIKEQIEKWFPATEAHGSRDLATIHKMTARARFLPAERFESSIDKYGALFIEQTTTLLDKEVLSFEALPDWVARRLLGIRDLLDAMREANIPDGNKYYLSNLAYGSSSLEVTGIMMQAIKRISLKNLTYMFVQLNVMANCGAGKTLLSAHARRVSIKCFKEIAASGECDFDEIDNRINIEFFAAMIEGRSVYDRMQDDVINALEKNRWFGKFETRKGRDTLRRLIGEYKIRRSKKSRQALKSGDADNQKFMQERAAASTLSVRDLVARINGVPTKKVEGAPIEEPCWKKDLRLVQQFEEQELAESQKNQKPKAKAKPTPKAAEKNKLNRKKTRAAQKQAALQQDLQVSIDYSIDDLRAVLALAMEADYAVDDRPLKALASEFAALKASKDPLDESSVLSKLADAESLAEQIRTAIGERKESQIVHKGFETMLYTALDKDKPEYGKHWGGTIKLGAENAKKYLGFALARFHRRLLHGYDKPLFAGKPVALRSDEALAFHVTRTSNTPNVAFCISVHLWFRRPGRTSPPSLDDWPRLRMNTPDWYDSRSTLCVLHVC